MKCFTVCAEFIISVEHQDVLDNDTVSLSVILVFSYIACPGRRPVSKLQVFVLSVNDLTPAGFIQTEDQVTVFILVGSLYCSCITGNDAVVVNADREAGFLGMIDQPCGAFC